MANMSELVATTINARSSAVADNLTEHNALLKAIKDNGNVESFDSGWGTQSAEGDAAIVEAIMYGENSNAGSYTGADLLTVNQTTEQTAAFYKFAQYAVPVVFTGTTELANAGKARISNLVKNKVKAAEITLQNLLNRHLYLDGTGNSGKNLTGIAAAIAASPSSGTYGGIDRTQSGNAFWRNKAYTSSSDLGGAAAANTIQAHAGTVLQSVTYGSILPDIIVAGLTYYNMLLASATPQQQFMSGKKADIGFEAFNFRGVEVVYDNSASGITATDAFYINTKFLKWRPHKDRNFTSLDDIRPANQDIKVQTLVWAGNLTCNGAKYQARHSIS